MSKSTDSQSSLSRVSAQVSDVLERSKTDPNFGAGMGEVLFSKSTVANCSAIQQLGMLLGIDTYQGIATGFATEHSSTNFSASCGDFPLGHISVNNFVGWHNPTGFDAHKRIKLGVPSEAIDPLAVFIGIGKGEIAELLDLDRSTALRLSKDHKLLPLHAAERVFRLLDLKEMASDVFEGEDGLNWLQKAHPMLDGETPLQASKTSFGAKRVKDILTAIKYGGVV